MIIIQSLNANEGDLCELTGSTVGHISMAPGFKPQLGYFRRVFHLSVHLITFGGCLAGLAFLVHKRDCKTPIYTLYD